MSFNIDDFTHNVVSYKDYDITPGYDKEAHRDCVRYILNERKLNEFTKLQHELTLPKKIGNVALNSLIFFGIVVTAPLWVLLSYNSSDRPGNRGLGFCVIRKVRSIFHRRFDANYKPKIESYNKKQVVLKEKIQAHYDFMIESQEEAEEDVTAAEQEILDTHLEIKDPDINAILSANKTINKLVNSRVKALEKSTVLNKILGARIEIDDEPNNEWYKKKLADLNIQRVQRQVHPDKLPKDE